MLKIGETKNSRCLKKLTHNMRKFISFFSALLLAFCASSADFLYDGFIQEAKLGDTKKITLPGGVSMELIYVEPGTFTMGSPKTEEGRNANEIQHSVTLTKGYWLGKYEVTQQQWESVMRENPSFFKGDLKPVENISWEDCQKFVKNVNDYLNCGARLPTEAEWEYACRAGTKDSYAKNTSLENLCWYSKNGYKRSHDVGTRLPNMWGFFDMHGNVWEWCQDIFSDYKGDIETDPTGATTGLSRVIRGGSWMDEKQDCRSARRNHLFEKMPNGALGFRLACTAGKKKADIIADNTSVMGKDVPVRQHVNGEKRIITLPGGATMEVIYVAPGSFVMGSPYQESGRDDDEIPHDVTLTKGYWLGKYEVTQKQWNSVMNNNPSFSKGDNRPVENISWNDCQEFIEEINEQLGCEARLPTEAEWEYACRAGTTTAYNFGSSLNGRTANCDGDYPYGTSQKGPNIGTTSDVGSYMPNAWGFYDMHGNVWEWCQDPYVDYPNYAVFDPVGKGNDIRRVVRGGGWYSFADRCRSAYRGWNKEFNRLKHNGVRLAFTTLPEE